MLKRLELSKSKVFLQTQIDYFSKEIEKGREELAQLVEKKSELLGFTAEAYANKKINEFYIDKKFSEKKHKLNKKVKIFF